MKLSGQTIRIYARNNNIIAPFSERTRFMGMTYGLSPAGYDVRIAESVMLPPVGFSLASTMEQFNMPKNIIAEVKDKSTWARQGLAVQNTVIEPGWRGYLTLELTNHGPLPISISAGMPIAQILFEFTDMPVDHPYEGKYQDQEVGPQGARYDQ